jgi:hypothetical protein
VTWDFSAAVAAYVAAFGADELSDELTRIQSGTKDVPWLVRCATPTWGPLSTDKASLSVSNDGVYNWLAEVQVISGGFSLGYAHTAYPPGHNTGDCCAFSGSVGFTVINEAGTQQESATGTLTIAVRRNFCGPSDHGDLWITGGTAADGDYDIAGTHNGKSYYFSAATGYYVWWEDFDGWVIGQPLGTYPVYWYCQTCADPDYPYGNFAPDQGSGTPTGQYGLVSCAPTSEDQCA